MSVLRILQKHEPMLRMLSQPVDPTDIHLHYKLVDDMVDTMLAANNGVGLAAPQVGRNVRLIVMRMKDGSPAAILNPVILHKSTERRHRYQEGCLSIPRDQWKGSPARAERVTLQYLRRDGKHGLLTLTGLQAIIIQHEVDHLNGVLFTDRCRPPVGKKHLPEVDNPFPIERRL